MDGFFSPSDDEQEEPQLRRRKSGCGDETRTLCTTKRDHRVDPTFFC